MESGNDIVGALEQLLYRIRSVIEQQLAMLASFVCDAYCPKSIGINHIPELRWCLAVLKTYDDSDKLPLTSGALTQHIRRGHVQARVWGQASIAQQEFLHPLNKIMQRRHRYVVWPGLYNCAKLRHLANGMGLERTIMGWRCITCDRQDDINTLFVHFILFNI